MVGRTVKKAKEANDKVYDDEWSQTVVGDDYDARPRRRSENE